jgi:hypothetical protein
MSGDDCTPPNQRIADALDIQDDDQDLGDESNGDSGRTA